MNRIMLSNGSNWFNKDEAIIIKKNTEEYVSEELYITKFRNFVLHRFSYIVDNINTFEKIDNAMAVEWLIKNNFEELKKSLKEEEITLLINFINNYEI